jgi:mannose/fructose/N-acetylgalactosamine-specific phosphotransferase system component IID
MALKSSEAIRLSARLLGLQVLLNYRTMQGAGYLFTLWPWLRQSPQRSTRAATAANYLNSHPVLAALAVGALRKRLEDGDAERDPAEVMDWQASLCGPLGLVGDTLIWDRWKPFVFSLGVLVLLWQPTSEVWIFTAAGCLLLYNVPLVYLRYRGMQEGYRLGARVLETLGRPSIGRWRTGLSLAGAVAAGWIASCGFWQAAQGTARFGVGFIAAFFIMWLSQRRRWSLVLSLLAAITAAWLIPPI